MLRSFILSIYCAFFTSMLSTHCKVEFFSPVLFVEPVAVLPSQRLMVYQKNKTKSTQLLQCTLRF